MLSFFEELLAVVEEIVQMAFSSDVSGVEIDVVHCHILIISDYLLYKSISEKISPACECTFKVTFQIEILLN